MDRQRATEVTIYSSWRGIAVSFLTPLLLLSIGLLGINAVGFRVVPIAFSAFGAGLMAVSLLDLPLQTHFDTNGVHRRCLLRRQTIPWDDVRLIQRARGNVKSYLQVRGSTSDRLPSGGLVVVVGRVRRYQLTDRIESRSEYDMLRDVVRLREGDVEVTAVRPSMASPPTTLYRRGVANPPPPADAF